MKTDPKKQGSGVRARLSAVLLPMVFWLLVWQAGASFIGREVLLPSPVQTLTALWEMAKHANFWHSLLLSLARVMSGYALAVVSGVALAALCAAVRAADTLLRPMRNVIKATPVTSFIILVLLWLSTGITPVFIAFLMVLPIIWTSVQTGIEETDADLLEMAHVYHVPFARRVRLWYAPSVLPQFRASCLTGLGFAWKSGVAAEVIAKPLFSVGRNLSDSKIYLETAQLFAWTLTVILLSMLLEKALAAALRAPAKRRYSVRTRKKAGTGELPISRVRVSLQNVSASYEGRHVLSNVSLTLPESGCLALTGPSGVGKTTLARVIAGMKEPDGGCVQTRGMRLAVVFQEDRLLPWLTARGNVEAVLPHALRGDAGAWLAAMEVDSPDALPSALSGGMRRRVALARALCARPELLILDEPFSGLDDALRARVAAQIKKSASLCVMITHDTEDIQLLQAVSYRVEGSRKPNNY